MASLFETLGTNTNAYAAPQDNTAQLSKIVATGTTGKAPVTSGSAQQSALGEAGAIDQTKQMMDQLNTAQTQQNIQQQYQAHQIDTDAMLQNKAVDAGFLNARSQFVQKSGELLSNLEQNRKIMKQEDAEKQMEAVATATRLSTEKYVFNLQMEGDKERLDNELAFKTQMQYQMFGDAVQLFRDQSRFNIDLNAQENQWSEQLGKLNIETALAVAGTKLAGQSQAAAWQAFGTTVEAGTKAYAAYGSSGSTSSAATSTPSLLGTTTPGVSTGSGTFVPTSNMNVGVGSGT